jgi:hypothetical protein
LTSRTETELPINIEYKTDILLPTFPEFLRDREDPKKKLAKTDARPEARTKPRRDIEEPKLAWETIEILEPHDDLPLKEQELPILVLPMTDIFKTEPVCIRPRTETPEPVLIKLRIDKADAIKVLYETDMRDPKLTNDLTEKDEPICK